MDSHGFMFNLVVYLSAAVIAVPLFVRLGLGSVLGYLTVGACIGPWGLGLMQNVGDILHFSELGVVLLLFLIGLELEPRKLWTLRRSILGIGGTQVLITAALICLLGLLLGVEVVTGGSDGQSTLVIVAVMFGIFIIGHFFLRHIFGFVASIHLREVFTALSLLLVTGIVTIMELLGISKALGAFLAGVLLANSEYRHALESDIDPFKGLLLGLFFISVGMSVNFGLLLENPLLIFALTAALVTIKTSVLYVIAQLAGIPPSQRGLFAFTLAQGGEFGFVLFGVAVLTGVMDANIANHLILVVALSMAITPLLLIADTKLIDCTEICCNERLANGRNHRQPQPSPYHWLRPLVDGKQNHPDAN